MPGRSLLPLILLAALLSAGALVYWQGGFTFESFVRHRDEIDRFVAEHRMIAVLSFIALYSAAVSFSIPGATVLTVTGGFLFGVAVGATASVIGATIGATVIFLLARSALGEPLLKRAGPRAGKLARSFRADAFWYLLFLRLIPALPFFLVNLVPALAGVRLAPFVAATALGVIPAAVVYALAGQGLGSVIDLQLQAQARCVAHGYGLCPLSFDARHILTPELIAALVGLALLALLPIGVARFRRTHSVSD